MVSVEITVQSRSFQRLLESLKYNVTYHFVTQAIPSIQFKCESKFPAFSIIMYTLGMLDEDRFFMDKGIIIC